MPNAALLLADILKEWDVDAGSALTTKRGIHRDWTPLRHVLALVEQVAVDIEGLKVAGDAAAEDYEPLVPVLYQFVLPVGRQWNSTGNPVIALDHRDLRLLRGLGRYLERVGLPATEWLPEQLKDLRESLDETKRLVIDSDLPGGVKHYLLGLLAEAMRCIDELDAVGEVRLQQQLFTLAGALEAVATAEDKKHPTEGKGKIWRERVGHLFEQVTTAAIAGVAGAATTGLLGM